MLTSLKDAVLKWMNFVMTWKNCSADTRRCAFNDFNARDGNIQSNLKQIATIMTKRLYGVASFEGGVGVVKVGTLYYL